MRQICATLSLALLPLISFATSGQTATSYAADQSRQIKSLSDKDVEGYLSGKGMGLAKAAELNGYPGPLHVLELAKELALTPVQEKQTQALFMEMKAQSTMLGHRLVEEERDLDALFARKAITTELLQSKMNRIGQLQAQVRQAHLAAHIAQAQVLTPEQISRYKVLRGYRADGHSHRHHDHAHPSK